MFICNHCPYVKAITNKLVVDMKALEGNGISSIAIMSNDLICPLSKILISLM